MFMRFLKLGLMVGGLIVGIHVGADFAFMVVARINGTESTTATATGA